MDLRKTILEKNCDAEYTLVQYILFMDACCFY